MHRCSALLYRLTNFERKGYSCWTSFSTNHCCPHHPPFSKATYKQIIILSTSLFFTSAAVGGVSIVQTCTLLDDLFVGTQCSLEIRCNFRCLYAGQYRVVRLRNDELDGADMRGLIMRRKSQAGRSHLHMCIHIYLPGKRLSSTAELATWVYVNILTLIGHLL